MHIHRILGIAALALGATLAACSDSTTAPQGQQSRDPLVQRLNELANGAAVVTAVRKADEVTPGRSDRAPMEPLMALKPCYYDEPCEPEPIDPNCYSSCAWFDVNAWINAGYYSSGAKWADLWAELYGYSGARQGTLWVSFQSAGGCTNYTSQFDAATLTASSGPYTLSTYRWADYSSGTITWRVYADGEVVNQYGRYGYESDSETRCH